MPFDIFGAWPRESRWIWLTIASWVLLMRGPTFVENLGARPPDVLIPDFFQEYASARNWFNFLPVYLDQHESVSRYLGWKLDDRRSYVFVNAHPPTSILLAFPLARLDFHNAFLAWNLLSLTALAASLWIVQWQLRLDFSAWSFAPLIALMLLCYPLWEQCRLGQLTLVVLLLMTGTWAAERSGLPWLAGALLGMATSIKLFPGFLFIYYAFRGRWKVALGGLITVACLYGLTAGVLGSDAYRRYIFAVLPEIQWFRVGWNNDSILGFWSRLFDPAPEHQRDRSLTQPLFFSPVLATSLSFLSSALVVIVLAWAVQCHRQKWINVRLFRTERFATVPLPDNGDHEKAERHSDPPTHVSKYRGADGPPAQPYPPPPQAMFAELQSESSLRRNDLTFALAITAMLLVSPICWEHYLLLLLVPLAVVWVQLPASRFARAAFLLIVAATGLGYPMIWRAFDLVDGRTAKPIHSLSVLSFQFYALLGLFALILMVLRQRERK